MQENKHHIKTRMLKTAARAWGLPETEAETGFDPLVGMLLSACATELEKLSSEIYASRARVTERLVQLLSPDVLTGSLPAHAVATATPVESQTLLTGHDQLYLRKKIITNAATEETAWKEIFFSPTGTFRLNKAAVKFMATGSQLYKVSPSVGKELIAHAGAGKSLAPSTLYLALDEPRNSLHGSQFYFDLRNEAESGLFYHHLPKAVWFLGDRQMETAAGYGPAGISGEHLDLPTVLGRSHNVSSRLTKTVNAFYKNSFVTLLDEDGRTAEEQGAETADLIVQTFSGREAQAVQQQPLRWLRIQFPQPVSNRLLQDVVCVTNAFPVVNRRLLELNYRLQETVNIVPLQTDDLFFDLNEITDDEGRPLTVRSRTDEEDGAGVLLRNGGIGRFDERDAAAVIQNLLQLLRDESAAFTSIGSDFVADEARQLQQIINRLDQRLQSLSVAFEQHPYLVIRNGQKKPWHSLFISYWSTAGKEANGLKAGTGLQLYQGGNLQGASAVLVTAAQGGRDKLNTTEAVLAYKSVLLSKERIVSAEDAKAFCYYQLGNRVKTIRVEKGVAIHPDRQKGYVKTIDVFIQLTKEAYNQMAELNEVAYWKTNLKNLLEERSASLLPYRILIESAN